MDSLKKQLILKKNCEENYLQAKNTFNKVYSDLWLNTNWEEVIGKKATIKDKESWIKLQPAYQETYTVMKQSRIDRDYVRENYELLKLQRMGE